MKTESFLLRFILNMCLHVGIIHVCMNAHRVPKGEYNLLELVGLFVIVNPPIHMSSET